MKINRKRVGLAAIVLSFLIFFYMNLPTMGGEVFTFPSTYKTREVTLQGTRWKVEGSEYAVLICPGYSCDRQKWRPFADLFVTNGYTTMVFDYAGQGASSSVIGFDNAKTDAIPVEIDDAIEVLHEWSGIDYDHIILMGHSMGGRAILRLLHDYNDPSAETTVSKKPVGAAIMFAPEVNYSFNAQASLFAGTADDVQEPWASYDPGDITDTDVYIYGSTADDIVSDENLLAVYARLGAESIPMTGLYEDSRINAAGSKITIGITPGVLHSYQMYSPEFAAYVNGALEDISGNSASFPPCRMLLIYLGWALALLGVFLTLSALNAAHSTEGTAEVLPVLTNPKKYLRFKLLCWLPGLVLAFLLTCLCVVMPFGSPIMNTPYMTAIAGYGLVMLFAYRKGRFPGTEGKLPSPKASRKPEKRELLRGVLAAAAICFFVWYVLRASMYRLIPFNARLFWVTFAGVLMSVGYYVSSCETEMLERAGCSRSYRVLYSLIQYVALFLLVLFYLVIGSYSGLIGQAQNMVLLYIFVIPLGEYLRRKTGSRLAGALVSGFVFQTLMITSAALIAVM